MAEYFLNALDSAKEHVSKAIGTVLNSSIGKQIWSVAEQLKATGATEDDFEDGSEQDVSGQDISGQDVSGQNVPGRTNPYENSAAKGIADMAGALGEDTDFAKDMRERAKQANATITERVFSDEGWDIAVKILVCVACIIFASFSANMAIFSPPIFRFFLFFFIFVNCWFFDTTFFVVALFYLFYMLTAIYKNTKLKPGEPRNKWIPHLYALLPLRTSKGPGWTVPFITYFEEGEAGIGHQFYKFYEADYVESIKKQIPSWNTVKNTLGVPALMSEFMDHLENMNVTYRTDASGAAVSTATLPANMKADDLFNKYAEAVTNGDKPLRTKVLARLMNKFISDKEANKDTELISHIEKYVDVLVKEGKLEEAEEMSRLLLSVYQSVSASRTGRGLASKGADEARARLYKVLEKRKKDIATKVNAIDKEIASRKANKLDTKKLEAEKAALEKQSASLNEEVTKLSAKIRFASTMPTYDTEGKDLNSEINMLMDSIKRILSGQAGGASAAAAAAGAPVAPGGAAAVGAGAAAAAAAGAPAKDEAVTKLTNLFSQINTVFDTNEAVDWGQLANAKAHILHLSPLTKILERSRTEYVHTGISNELVKGISDEVIMDKNLREAQIASAHEETEHAIDRISKYSNALHLKAGLYKEFMDVLKSVIPKFKEAIEAQKKSLESRFKKIENLYALIHPADGFNVNHDLQQVLKLIPGTANSANTMTFKSRKANAVEKEAVTKKVAENVSEAHTRKAHLEAILSGTKQEHERTKQEHERISDETDTMVNQVREKRGYLEAATKSHAELQRQLDDAEAAHVQLENDVAAAQKRVANAEKALKTLGESTSSRLQTTKDVTSQASAAEAELAAAEAKLAGLKAQLKTATDASAAAERQVAAAEANAERRSKIAGAQALNAQQAAAAAEKAAAKVQINAAASLVALQEQAKTANPGTLAEARAKSARAKSASLLAAGISSPTPAAVGISSPTPSAGMSNALFSRGKSPNSTGVSLFGSIQGASV